MKFKNFFNTGLVVVCLGLVYSCSKDDQGAPENPEAYNTKVSITDAPIDNANVQAAFITISEVNINGKSIEGFQKTTVNISSLQNGNSELLGNLDLESGTTSEITLVLDNESDASGDAPGNYILTVDGEKKALVTTSGIIEITDNLDIQAVENNEIVLDFDLRKAIVEDESTGDYKFVSETELGNSIRAVNSLETGIISGTVSNMNSSDAETMVVFVYKKGTYTEAEAGSENNGGFSNAVSSSSVSKADGDFELHFIEEGEYELHFASFSDTNSNGSLEFEGMLDASSATAIDLQEFSVEADTEIAVEVVLAGLLGL
ncbi:MAG TPA: DUF4382 domain-containing protein [Gillisia sp.]|nr:DUF4382 domain-containing protein [Gillisia sp.]